MKYTISTYGASIAVGMLDPEQTETDTNLSHNLFNTYVNDHYYHGVLIFSSLNQFYKLLIYKNLFADWSADRDYLIQLREATNKVRSVINNEIRFDNFMPQVMEHKASLHLYNVVK
jgi:hypothetical protein